MHELINISFDLDKIMDYYYNIHSFDISTFLDQYKGKKLEDIFDHHSIIHNDFGSFIEFYWLIDASNWQIDLLASRKKLLRNLKTVYYIGEKIERKLLKKGVKSILDLKFHTRYNKNASELIDLIRGREYEHLLQNRYIYDLDVSFCFKPQDLLFIDIETLGIYDSPIIIIGLGFFQDNQYQIKILFARNLEEEIALCDHFRKEILPHFKCFISYNGKSFDIPYIANRLLYFFEENPMISNDEVPYENANTKYHHIDLYHNCRRKYKGLFNSYTLTNIERKLLEMKRENELPSTLVGFCYQLYLEDPQENVGLIREVINHNYWDVYSLPLILSRLLA
ncbi:MAG: ribonuclease H-like domain-containing protein [Candidatus Lokiarchaeota archaeon]